MKRVIYNKLKPTNYYNHLFTFFGFMSIVLTLTLVGFTETFSIELFLLKFIVIFFLLLFISVAIEFLYKGEYIAPHTFYDLEIFFNEFLDEIHELGHFEKFFYKYDAKSKKRFNRIFKKHKINFFLSSIRRHGNTFELSFIDEVKMMEFFFVKFLIKHGVHKMEIKKFNGKFKIIRLV